jgi:hypothetical protein
MVENYNHIPNSNCSNQILERARLLLLLLLHTTTTTTTTSCVISKNPSYILTIKDNISGDGGEPTNSSEREREMSFVVIV